MIIVVVVVVAVVVVVVVAVVVLLVLVFVFVFALLVVLVLVLVLAVVLVLVIVFVLVLVIVCVVVVVVVVIVVVLSFCCCCCLPRRCALRHPLRSNIHYVAAKCDLFCVALMVKYFRSNCCHRLGGPQSWTDKRRDMQHFPLKLRLWSCQNDAGQLCCPAQKGEGAVHGGGNRTPGR